MPGFSEYLSNLPSIVAITENVIPLTRNNSNSFLSACSSNLSLTSQQSDSHVDELSQKNSDKVSISVTTSTGIPDDNTSNESLNDEVKVNNENNTHNNIINNTKLVMPSNDIANNSNHNSDGEFHSLDNSNSDNHEILSDHTPSSPSISNNGNNSKIIKKRFQKTNFVKRYSFLENSMASSLSPAGLAGVLTVTLVVHPNSSSVQSQSFQQGGGGNNNQMKVKEVKDIFKNLEKRYCILLEGSFTYMPLNAVSNVTSCRSIGSLENKTFALNGYVVTKQSEVIISLSGSRGETTGYLLEAETVDDCDRWLEVLSGHIEFIDYKAGSRWLF